MSESAKILLQDCQDFLDGLKKGDFKEKGQFYAAEALRNRLRAYNQKAGREVDLASDKKKWRKQGKE